jgi:hypothetical protein
MYRNKVKAIRLVESDSSRRSGRILAVDDGKRRMGKRKQQNALES